MTICGSRRCTRSPTRAPGIWKTFWRAEPGYRSSRGIAAWSAPKPWPDSWLSRSAGTRLQLQREVTHYRTRVAAERESQNQRDDATADAARLGAPDIVRTG